LNFASRQNLDFVLIRFQIERSTDRLEDFIPIPTAFEGSAKTLKEIVENSSVIAKRIEIIPKANANISQQLKAKTKFAPKKPGSKVSESAASTDLPKPELVPLAPPPVDDEEENSWKPSTKKMFDIIII
jgi:hypothetical protein